MPESPEQNPDKTISEEELSEIRNFPEIFLQLYDFTGPENGGFLFWNLKEYDKYSDEEKLNFMKFHTHESVINFFKLFYRTLREKIIAENPAEEEEEIKRKMAHSDLGAGIRGVEKNVNLNDAIGFIEKTGMHEENAVYDVEKYLDIQEISMGQTVKGYND